MKLILLREMNLNVKEKETLYAKSQTPLLFFSSIPAPVQQH